MNPERHRLEVELFEAACDLPPEERAAFLDDRCGDDDELRQRLGVLLEADSMPLTELAEPALDLHELVGDAPAPASAAALPETIADFDVVRELGRGGMGIVYEAEQHHPRRRVALKVVRSHWMTASTLRRFEHEAEVLGWLHHPGIAQVYEAGTWNDGERDVPYFAMELVRGTPLVRWADEHGLGPTERLRLFVRVCEAVHHAHTKGVIHRDLKPSNILVDEHGQPKVLDFGVARVMQSELSMTTMHTRSGELVGTLKYMSPEQVASDPEGLDTRSDVYALGVLAYELLIGRAPYDLAGRAVHEAALVILQEEPSSLGAFDARLKGDVETIVSKAVAKERERRYASAEELASDVRRYLADEPIVARPPSRLYQLRKFARRNRTLVGGVVAVFVALAAGLVVALSLYRRAEEARVDAVLASERAAEAEAEARREAGAADRVSAFLVQLFDRADAARGDGGEPTAVELLDEGARAIGDALLDEPELRGRLLRVMGRAYHGLGLNERALELLAEGVALGRAQGRRDAGFAAEVSLYGRVLQFQGRFAEAEDVLAEAVQLHRAARGAAGADDVAETRARIDLAALLAATGRATEAEAIQRKALAHLERELEPDDPRWVFALREYAATLHTLGRHAEATPLQERAVAIVRAAWPDRPNELVLALSDLGWGHMYAGSPDVAAELFEEALALAAAVYDERHSTLALMRYNLASALTDRERYEEAERLFESALDVWLSNGGPTHHATAAVMDGYAELLARTGRFEAASELRAQVAAADLEHFGPGHPRIATNATRSAELARERGRPELALAELERALEATIAAWGSATVHSARALARVGDALSDLGRAAEACERWSASVERYRAVAPSDAGRVRPLRCLAGARMAAGRFAEAESALLEAWELTAEREASEDERAALRAELVELYEAWPRPDAADRWRVAR